MLYGIVGKKESGKTTIAEYMAKGYGYILRAFADPLKEMILKAGMCTWEELNTRKTNRSRYLMQKIGTEIFREQVDPLYWIKKMDALLRVDIHFNRDVVVHDVRFPDEGDLIHTLGGKLIRVERSGNGKRKDNHASETAQDAIVVDYLIKNYGTIPELYCQIDSIVRGVKCMKE